MTWVVEWSKKYNAGRNMIFHYYRGLGAHVQCQIYLEKYMRPRITSNHVAHMLSNQLGFQAKLGVYILSWMSLYGGVVQGKWCSQRYAISLL